MSSNGTEDGQQHTYQEQPSPYTGQPHVSPNVTEVKVYGQEDGEQAAAGLGQDKLRNPHNLRQLEKHEKPEADKTDIIQRLTKQSLRHRKELESMAQRGRFEPLARESHRSSNSQY